MRNLLSALAIFTILILCPSLHATPVTYPIVGGTYSISAVATDGYTLSGSVTMDSSGVLSAASLTFFDNNHDPLDTTYPTFSTVIGTGSYTTSGTRIDYIGGSGGRVELTFGLTTTLASGLPNLCFGSSACGSSGQTSGVSISDFIDPHTGAHFNTSGQLNLSSGSFAPASIAATPEPSSLALLGTGLAGVAATIRRRIRKS